MPDSQRATVEASEAAPETPRTDAGGARRPAIGKQENITKKLLLCLRELAGSIDSLERRADDNDQQRAKLSESVASVDQRVAKLAESVAALEERPEDALDEHEPETEETSRGEDAPDEPEPEIEKTPRGEDAPDEPEPEIEKTPPPEDAPDEPEPEQSEKEKPQQEIGSNGRGMPSFSLRKKESFCTGICFSPDEVRAVLLSGRKKDVVLRDLMSVPLNGTNKLEAVKSALEQMNKRISLKRGPVHVALSSEDVSVKFLQLSGLSDKQIGQAVEQQMKTEEGWDPSAYYLDFHPVGMMGNQTRIFVTYVSRDLVTSLLDLLASFGSLVFVVEPDLSALHRALLFSGALADNKVAAVINVEPRRGLVTLFTERGVILHRNIGRLLEEPAGMIGEEESNEQDARPEAPAGIAEEFRVDLAVDEMIKTFDYYEYSLTGDRIDSVILIGDPGLTTVMGQRITDDVGVNVKPFTIDIDLRVPPEDFDPPAYGTAVGTALSSMLVTRAQ